jgi:exopolysaccharide biosynthesis protein
MDGKPKVGVIAQEVEKVVPEVVATNADGYKSVSYGNLVGVLIEAVKSQQTQIDELRKLLEK